MASKRRLRRVACQRKARHPTYQGALIAIRKTEEKMQSMGLIQHGYSGTCFLRPYKCGNHWHIGHGGGEK